MTDVFEMNGIEIHQEDALKLYDEWEDPVVIVSDGAYGTDSFPTDTKTTDALTEWYEPHIRKWSENATPMTTLWFWNTEIGWATVHPVLEKYGWKYRGCNIWHKGIQHISGNSNTKTLRRFPPVTEVCVQYVKRAEFETGDGTLNMQGWLRHEWDRAGLRLWEADEACVVADAASRKYLSKDHLWYYPPPEMFERLVEYANQEGDPEGRPYFSIDGETPLTKEEWRKMRSKFDLDVGVTNVWDHPAMHGDERIRIDGETAHLNQKPLKLIRRIIEVSSDSGDMVWEPFGGLCTAAIASRDLGRECRAAEIEETFYQAAIDRIKQGSITQH